MRSYLLLLSLAPVSLASLWWRGGCNADNCARAVTGTRYALSVQSSHTADCSSFMIQTITPAASTSTVTITPTSYSIVGMAFTSKKREALPTLAARQVIVNPSDVPVYASACSGTVRYSSACSCAGITQVTSYAPTPTVTSTTYLPAVVTPVCDPANTYGYQYTGGFYDPRVGYDIVANAFDEQGCCAACFQQGSSCLAYIFQSGSCSLEIELAGPNPPTDYCPYGVYLISTEGVGNIVGVGPCAFVGPI